MDCDPQARPSSASLVPIKPLKPSPCLKLSEGDDEDAIIQFTTVRELFQSINQAVEDVLTVEGVSAHNFTKIEAKRDRSGRKFRFHYFADESLLTVTIPSGPHAYISAEIDLAINLEIIQMGSRESWKSTGRTTFTSNSGTLEADASGKPIPQRLEDSEWPTLVIEVGYSQSLIGLRRTMRYWFNASSHQVKIVILAKIQRHQGMIVIEKWKEGPLSNRRPGATNTRACGVVKPYCDSTTIITQTDTVAHDPQSYSISRSVPLRLEFELLFLRAPGPGEHDVMLTIQELQECAAKAMGGMPARG